VKYYQDVIEQIHIASPIGFCWKPLRENFERKPRGAVYFRWKEGVDFAYLLLCKSGSLDEQ
jgi:hypothetical protein